MPLGRWRIAWLGDIAFHEPARTQPSVTVVLESLDEASQGRLTETVVPIAQLWALKLGSVWHDKLLTDEVDARRNALRVTFKTWNASSRPAGANIATESGEAFLLPFASHTFHRDHTKAWCLTVGVEGRIVVFPAMELIRFYFASSGSLLRKLFSANFEPGLLAKQFSMNERRKASVILADDIAAVSAQDVARIVLNDHAGTAARLISRSLVAGRAGAREDVKVYARTAFPFAGDADLTIEGVEIPSPGGPPRFLVHELVQCRARFPFSALEYVASSRRRSTSPLRESEIQADGSSGSPRRIASRRSAGQIESEEPRATSTRQIRTDSRGRFPDLESKAVWRSTTDTSAPVDVTALPAAPYDSTGRGTTTGDGMQVDLTEGGGGARLAVLESPCEQWAPYFQFLALLAVQEWVEDLAFVQPGRDYKANHYWEMPAVFGDGALAEKVVAPSRLEERAVKRWASLVNVRVGDAVTAIFSISPWTDDLANTVRIRPRQPFEEAGAWQAVMDASGAGAEAGGWMTIAIPFGSSSPWHGCALAVDALRMALTA